MRGAIFPMAVTPRLDDAIEHGSDVDAVARASIEALELAFADSGPEVILSTSDLTGTAPTGAAFGINTIDNTFYKVVSGSWVVIASVNASDFDLTTLITAH